MSNYKMEIFFNLDNIDNDTIEIMIDKISNVATQRHFKTDYKNGVLQICGTGKDDDFANMGVIISALKRKIWFFSRINKWLFYDSENTVEDLYYRYNLSVQ